MSASGCSAGSSCLDGALRLRELSLDRIDTVLQGLRAQSLNRRRQARVITGAMLETTVRHGALAVNPARQAVSILRPRPSAGRWLSTTSRQCGPPSKPGQPATGQGLGTPRTWRTSSTCVGRRTHGSARCSRSGGATSTSKQGRRPGRSLHHRQRAGHASQADRGVRTVVLPELASCSCTGDTGGEPHRCRLPDEERHLAAGHQRRTARESDPEGQGAGVGGR
jgi:hypothetical protein